MEMQRRTGVGEFLAELATALSTLDPDPGVMSDAERCRVALEALDVAGRMHALALTLVAEAAAAGSSLVVHGVPTLSWLADVRRLTRRDAAAMLHEGERLRRFDLVRESCLAGAVSPQQARAVVRVLDKLPDDLTPDQAHEAEAQMVGFCDRFDSRALGELTRHLVDQIAPEVGEEAEARRLERELRGARASRFLSFVDDGMGSTLIRGSLPVADAELLKAQVEAFADRAHRRALDARDPLVATTSRAMRRADGLVELCRRTARVRVAPRHGGDRPRVVVVIPYERLLTDCADAGLLEGGEALTPGQLRQLACDAGVLPVVLGGDSIPLDVGRERRLVTPELRAALAVRDRGCVFPGCDRRAEACDAHHLVPWQRGGPTAVTNLGLFCPHHHQVVEPGDAPPGRRWQAVMGSDGLVDIIPPRHVDPAMAPRRHQRFTVPRGRAPDRDVPA